MKPRSLLFAALLVCASLPALAQTTPATPAPVAPVPVAPAPATAAERQALTRGRELIADFYALRVERVWQAFTTQARADWGTLNAFRAFREAGVQTYGAEKRMLRERTFTDDGVTYYVRSATFEGDTRNVWALVFGFDAVGRVGVFAIAAEGEQEPERVAFAGR
ncbi:hypothetical protein V3W47_10340 [Deinococcus sp. YIM 134068]|uniref:hypothetical protein n=1 Tax=Deinococcus lichenicola TaxID=3118910 RepID=UPI002F94555E